MLILPLGLDVHGWDRGRTPVTILGLLLAVAVAALETWAWRWGPTFAPLADAVVWLRAYSAADDGLFRPWQVWTTALVHPGWGALLLAGLTWWLCVGACERRVGSMLTAVLVLVAIPAATASAVLLGRATPDLGLYAAALACGAGILGLAPRAGIRWWIGWWAVRWVGAWRARMPLAVWLPASAVLMLIAVAYGGDPRISGSEGWPLAGIALALSALLGQVLIRAVVATAEPAATATLEQLLAGRCGLDRLDEVLGSGAPIDRAALRRVAERAMHQQDLQAVRSLIAHLVVHDPEAPLLERLRDWLAHRGSSRS